MPGPGLRIWRWFKGRIACLPDKLSQPAVPGIAFHAWMPEQRNSEGACLDGQAEGCHPVTKAKRVPLGNGRDEIGASRQRKRRGESVDGRDDGPGETERL